MPSSENPAAVPGDAATADDTRITGGTVFGHLNITLLLIGLTLFARHKISHDGGLSAAISDPNRGKVAIKTVVITRKWQHRDFAKSGDVVLDTPTSTTYWVAWQADGRAYSSESRINLSPERYEAVEVGGPLEILMVAGGKTPRTRNDIALTQGNRSFDFGMLWVGQIGAALGILTLPFSLYAWRHPDSS